MSKVIPLSGNYAVAYAVKAADVDVVAAYPITPQTAVVEKVAEFVANGELDAEFLHVESEHSALSAVLGASAAGARVFTATSAQGLLLMYEIMHIASTARLPIVMGIATRAISAPINIWCDHSDFMAASDTGWIMLMALNAQEAHDLIIAAYRIAEDPRVHIPVAVGYDGFIVSHTVEPVDVVEREKAIKYAPKRVTWYTLNPEKPMTMGSLASPDWYFEFRVQLQNAIESSREVISEAFTDFKHYFGREYREIDSFYTDDADVVLVSMGSATGTVLAFVEEARRAGMKVGLLNVRLFRPFPEVEIAKHLENAKVVAVLDRAMNAGSSFVGPLYSDIVVTMFKRGLDIPVINHITGLGGRAVLKSYVESIVKHAYSLVGKKMRDIERHYSFIGVRE
ncbi:MAG: pyruvate ferredoxin oxidoreductase [Sulfolobales archaeon]|nr:pyruvate ferredoxin oxidoreductase [Sulfolobales archaeon]MDW8082603.1 pyruvate ferredoxin oxidoreductase [Sulfolobales archaeon]